MKRVDEGKTAVSNPWAGATEAALTPPVCHALSCKEFPALLLTLVYKRHVGLREAAQPAGTRQKLDFCNVLPIEIAFSPSVAREPDQFTSLVSRCGRPEFEGFDELFPHSRTA